MIQRNDPCWCGSGKKYKKCHLTIDARLQTPAIKRANPRWIKTPREIDGMRRAGRFNGRLMDYIRAFVVAGVSTERLDQLVYAYTLDHGHKPACLGYHGYPKSICTSVNNVVCHGIPSATEILKEGDIVNIDCTTIVDGFYGDSSETFMIGAVAPAARNLVGVTAQALIKGIAAARPGAAIQAVAQSIEPYVESQGCSVVQQYTGHGIGKSFHEYFSVYHHIDPDFKDFMLMPGLTFTIEPMINQGRFEVATDSVDKWTARTKDGSLSAQFEHTVLVTAEGCEALTLTPSQIAAGKIVCLEGM
ncbi:MAG: type I methionyl aminopeptidase [Chitinivibrionales bacterium]|nr:type I methionyl aminopeptidase [Chitinivibrionales bacterium]